MQNLEEVTEAKVYDRTADAVIYYKGSRERVIDAIRQFHYQQIQLPDGYLEHSGRKLNATYQEKLVDRVLLHYAIRFCLPAPVRAVYTTFKSVKYIAEGIKTLWNKKIEVAVLDGAAVGVSIIRGDFNTAGSVMFLLGIGELLEEWTHKKSVGDLARTMSLNVGRVWMKRTIRRSLSPVIP